MQAVPVTYTKGHSQKKNTKMCQARDKYTSSISWDQMFAVFKKSQNVKHHTIYIAVNINSLNVICISYEVECSVKTMNIT